MIAVTEISEMHQFITDLPAGLPLVVLGHWLGSLS
jgi:hypothetical protein